MEPRQCSQEQEQDQESRGMDLARSWLWWLSSSMDWFFDNFG